MGSERQPPSGDTDHLVRAAILADSRQRQLLSILLEQSGPVTERDLAVQLAAREAKTSPADVPAEARQRIRWDLYHRCFPLLETVGWIERYPVGIAAAEELSFGSLEVSRSELESLDNDTWEALATLLARPRRQHVVSIVADHDHPLTLEDLGAELAASLQTAWTDGGKELSVRAVLHHVDLPPLEKVGLIEYDRDEKSITQGHLLTTLVDRLSVR